MTVSANNRRREYPGNGETVLFNGPMAYEASHIQVYLANSSGALAVVNPTQYQVDNVGREAGTRITMNTPPASDELLILLRTVPLAQTVDISNQSNFNANVLEKSDDLLAMQIQQLADGSMLVVFDPISGAFVWDAKGNRIINVGDPIGQQDAVNLRSLWTYVETVLAGGGSVGVSPQLWEWEGDGESSDFPLPGADVEDPLFYDTAMEVDGEAGEYNVLKPGTDFTIVMGETLDDTVIRFPAPIPAGVKGFTILRGFARPYIGPAPIDTTAMQVVVLAEDALLVDGTYQNKLIVTTSADPVTLTVRENTGNADLDWGRGVDAEFFCVYQQGAGQVEIVPEGVGTITPPADFVNKTRAVGSTISCTLLAPDADAWMTAGDLLRTAVTPSRQTFRLVDRAALIGTNATTGTAKDSFIMPYDFQLDSIASRGCYAGLSVAQAAGSVFTIDVNVNGTSILSTKLTFDNTEKSTITAATPAVYETTFDTTNNRTIPAGAEVTFDIDQVGTAMAKGAAVYLVGTRAG